MTDVATGVNSKYSAKKDFCSHIIGIAKAHHINDFDQTIDHLTLPKIVTSYEQYTHKRYGGERLHAGKTIKFSQFVKSAFEHY